jgi:hypothetical protein
MENRTRQEMENSTRSEMEKSTTVGRKWKELGMKESGKS